MNGRTYLTFEGIQDNGENRREAEGNIINGDHVAEAKYAVRYESVSLSWPGIGQRGAFPYETVPLPNMVHPVLLHRHTIHQFSLRDDRASFL